MCSKRRRCVIALFIFILILAPISAVQIRWSWYGDFDYVSGFRYRLVSPERTEWHLLDKDAREVITEGVYSVENRLELQTSLDNITWSDPIVMNYTPLYGDHAPSSDTEENSEGLSNKLRWGLRVTASPYTLGFIDFYNGHDVEGAKYLTITKMAASGWFEGFFDAGKHVSFSFGGGYTYAEKPQTVIPDAETIHYARVQAGVDGYFLSKEKMKMGLGMTMGTAVEINAGRWNIVPSFGIRFSLEWLIFNSFSLGAVTGGSLSYHGNQDPFMRSLTWMLDPVALTAAYRF